MVLFRGNDTMEEQKRNDRKVEQHQQEPQNGVLISWDTATIIQIIGGGLVSIGLIGAFVYACITAF